MFNDNVTPLKSLHIIHFSRYISFTVQGETEVTSVLKPVHKFVLTEAEE